MTFQEHILAMLGHEEAVYLELSMHRRTAYEVYLSRPKGKSESILTIQKFMPIPTDKKNINDSLKKIREVHKLMLERVKRARNHDGKRT